MTDCLEDVRFQGNLGGMQFKKTAMTPERSLEQRRDALQNANVIRTYRANLKRDLKAQRVRIVDLLVDPPEELETMKIFDLLLAVPKYGRVKADKLLRTCRMSPSKTVGGMSDRQRAELLAMLRKR